MMEAEELTRQTMRRPYRLLMTRMPMMQSRRADILPKSRRPCRWDLTHGRGSEGEPRDDAEPKKTVGQSLVKSSGQLHGRGVADSKQACPIGDRPKPWEFSPSALVVAEMSAAVEPRTIICVPRLSPWLGSLAGARGGRER